MVNSEYATTSRGCSVTALSPYNICYVAKQLEFLEYSQPPTNISSDCSIINVFTWKTVQREDSMIHINVPDTQTLVEKDGITKYTAFNIHINGWFHAAVRFSHLYQVAEMIKQRFGSKYNGPDFPPKKLFHLDEKQIEDRRNKISKYLSTLVQNTDIIRSSLVEKKFLELQVNFFRTTSTHVSVDIYLGDGERIVVKCNIDSPTNVVLRQLSDQLGIKDPEIFLWNFGLFMACPKDTDGIDFNVLCVRFLRNFESPYISLQTANMKSTGHGIHHKLVLRKLIWDPRIEEALFEDSTLTKLLYKQAKNDFLVGNFEAVRSDIVDRLRSCEKNEDHIQFLRLCHLQPSYSYEILADCFSDNPRPNTRCSIKIGRRQLVLGFENGEEAIYRATRIRVWRISPPEEDGPMIFQFEYLMAKDDFEWVTLYTDQAIILSLLLQCVGTEILQEHRNMSIEQQLMTNGGGSGMSVFLEPSKAPLILKPTLSVPEDDFVETETNIMPNTSSQTERKTSSHSIYSLRSAKSAITSIEETSSLDRGDPLGVADLYDTSNDMFTTISDALPLHNSAFANITDDDL
ncbi:unnamed protein product [Auanema sp. JU1783]|nr:unnamed protein product [Auanema sp. JU1783]